MSKIAYRPYQERIRDFILDTPRCGLWVDMGLGKTLPTLAALEALLISGEVKKALVVAPLRVVLNVWPEEIRKWGFGIRHSVLRGSKKQVNRMLYDDSEVHLINYENLRWLVNTLNKRWPYDMVIADESTKLKGFRSRQGAKNPGALRPIAHQQVRRWVNLTGTPSPNGLQDLWGQHWFLDHGLQLGTSFEAYKNRWFKVGYNGYGLTALPHAQDEIHARLNGSYLSLRTKDYFDLPPVVHNKVYIDLTPKVRKLYKQLLREMVIRLEQGGQITAVNAAALTNKCHQLANGVAYDQFKSQHFVHDEKIKALDEIVEESGGENLLVSYTFASDLAHILARFPQARALDKQEQTVRDWNAGRIPMLVAHPQSCGHGLNLQGGGRTLVFYSVDWSPEGYQQIIERIGPARQMAAGRSKPVRVHYILARDTIDDTILERLQTKEEIQAILRRKFSIASPDEWCYQ